MDGKQKRVAAAMAAVNAYLDEEARAMEAEDREAKVAAAPSLWAMSGRQRIMNYRELLAARLWK